MNRSKKWLSFLLVITMIFTLVGCSTTNEKHNSKDFNSYLSDYFIEEVTSDTISLHYTIANPESYGISESIQTFGNYSIEKMKEELTKAENNLNILNQYDVSTLTSEEQLIYKILNQSLSQTLKLGDYLYYQECLGPTTGLQAQLPILLAEFTFYDEEDVKDYLGMLASIKDFYSEIASFEREKASKGYFMSDDVADLIIAQCADFIASPKDNFLIETFDEKVSNLTELNSNDIILYQEKNRDLVLDSVIPSYQLLIDTLTELKGSSKNENGLCGFEGGKDFYELMVQLSTGSSKTVAEMKTALETTLNKSRATMTTIALTNESIYNEYMGLKFPSSEPTEIIEYLKDIIKDDFPSLEDVNCNIKYVHESLEDHLSPAMYLVPPIDYYTENNIYINNNESYDMEMIFPTIAHEGYPGHLFQNVYFRQNNPNPVRSVINVSGYDEGWATYVELYSYDFVGFSKDLANFLKANSIALHCLYSLTDIGIHYDGWTKEKVLTFWGDYGVDKQTAEEIYTNILAEPGIYLPYSIGYLEIMELRDIAKEKLKDDFNMKEFHEFFLDIGPTQFGIIKEYLNDWINSKQAKPTTD